MRRFVIPALAAALVFSAGLSSANAAGVLTANSDRPCLIDVAAPAPATFDRFGGCVALSGDTLAVTAAPLQAWDAASPTTGPSVDIFSRSASGWSLQQHIVLPAEEDWQGATAISLQGDRLAVGAYDGVHILERTDGTWTETALIGDFGQDAPYGLALDGNTLAVGTPTVTDPSGAGYPTGAVRVYVLDDTGWTEQQRLTPDTDKASNFGQSLALNGDFLAIGAPNEQEGTHEGAGAVYTFERAGATWTQSARIAAPEPMTRGLFGGSVALDGSRLAVSMYGWESQTGAVYILDREADDWKTSARIVAPDGRPGNLVDYGGDSFGISMALAGDTLAVGAPENDEAGSNSGSVYVLRKVGDGWIFQRKITAPGRSTNGYFGMVLANDNGRVAVGMPGTSDTTGSVYAFDLGLMTPVDTTLTVSPDALLANDAIPEGADVIVSASTGPGHGTLIGNGDDGFEYTPTTGWSGSDTFAYSLVENVVTPTSLRIASEQGASVATVAVGVWRPTTLRLSASSTSPAYSGSTTLRVSLSTDQGVPITGRAIALEVLSGTKWVSIGTKITSSSGAVSLTLSGLTSAREYRARTAFSDVFGAASARVRVSPRVSIGTPGGPTSAHRGRSFSISGTLKPRHTSGTKPVVIRCYRLQGGKWVLVKSVAAKVKNYSTYSKYYATLSLPSSGSWRLYAYHAADGTNAATTSGAHALRIN